MSFFKNLFQPKPVADPRADRIQRHRELIKKNVVEQFARLEQLIDELYERHDMALVKLGLPVPKRTTGASYKLEFSRDDTPRLTITMPQYDIPPHFAVPLGPRTYILVTENLKEARKQYECMGLGGLVKFPHRTIHTWRPYNLYFDHNRSLSEYVVPPMQDGESWFQQCRGSSADDLPRLAGNLTVLEAIGIDFRARLFHQLSGFPSDGYPPVYAFTKRLNATQREDIFSKFAGRVKLSTSLWPPSIDPPFNETPYRNLKILPAGQIKPAMMIEFFSSLRTLNCPIAFELIASGGSVYFQLGVPEKSVALVTQQLSNFFPEFAVLDQPEVPELSKLSIARASQRHICYGEIAALRTFSLDPYTQIAPLLEQTSEQGFACLQVILQPVSDQDGQQLRANLKSYFEKYGEDWKKYGADLFNRLSKKLPIWVAGITCISTDGALAERLLKTLTQQYNTSEQTINVWMDPPASSFPRVTPEFLVLSTDEVASLAHFPTTPLPLPALERTSMKAQLPPEPFRTGEVPIGESEVRKQRVPVALPDSVRDRHLYIVGKTRMGKSTLITNIALADIDRGAGVCVIDPHGDLVEELLHTIPEHRVADTIYFNANDKEHPIALNVFQAKNDDEVALLADNLHVTFRRLSESWGQRMDDILRATLQTLAATPGSTFIDIKRLLQDPAFRGRVTANLDHPMLRDFWQLDFAGYPKDAPNPIIGRVNRFLFAPHFYRMFSTAKNALSVADVVAKQKILLVNLASGAIGDDNATVLGSLLVSQIQQAVMRRAGLPKEARTPYYLFVDEFQNFTNSAFDKILSEAGKYKLCLTLAHQFISQLQDNQRDAIFGNVGTMIMFGVGDKDANYLRNQIGVYEQSDLLDMPPHQALCRPATSTADTFHFKTIPPPQGRPSFAREIIENTHAHYSLSSEKQTTAAEETAPTATVETPRPEKPAPPPAPIVTTAALRPAVSLPKEFGSTTEKILHYVDQAEYLSTQQIIALCYGHQSENSRKGNASRDLGKLVGTKQLKELPFGSGKIYTTARLINPTQHNLAVRDLLVKILLSRYEVAGLNLKPQLASHNPDLEVSFLAESGGLIKTFWEYDAGTEGIEVLRKKVDCYAPYAKTAITTFVFNSRDRLEKAGRGACPTGVGWMRLSVLSEFNSLDDPAFIVGENSAQPFFGHYDK
jgi:hypothetical protein